MALTEMEVRNAKPGAKNADGVQDGSTHAWLADLPPCAP